MEDGILDQLGNVLPVGSRNWSLPENTMAVEKLRSDERRLFGLDRVKRHLLRVEQAMPCSLRHTGKPGLSISIDTARSEQRRYRNNHQQLLFHEICRSLRDRV